MASRAFSSSLRTTLRSTLHSSTRSTGRRMMSSTHAAPKSDRPWIIASGLFFTPLFLYLVSPTGRGLDAKDAHGHGHEKHESKPAPQQEVPAVIMTDDEGTKADISGSLAAAEATDVPEASGAEPPAVKESEPESSSAVKDDEGTPTDVGKAVQQSVKLLDLCRLPILPRRQPRRKRKPLRKRRRSPLNPSALPKHDLVLTLIVRVQLYASSLIPWR
ncbi:hypothetical protein CPB85DRAFT_1279574 [Mucidula mucida]|nr:hypothetical protein CPB85DRAFT_1279574 [Mucidula mucida]